MSRRGASQLASRQAVQAAKQAHPCAGNYADVRQPSMPAQAYPCAGNYADVRQSSRHTLVQAIMQTLGSQAGKPLCRQSAQGQYAVAAGTLEACRINLALMYS